MQGERNELHGQPICFQTRYFTSCLQSLRNMMLEQHGGGIIVPMISSSPFEMLRHQPGVCRVGFALSLRSKMSADTLRK